MAHQEFGFQVVQKFLKELVPYAHPDAPPKLIGRGINVMLSPLPRNKRARNPHGETTGAETAQAHPEKPAPRPDRPEKVNNRTVPVNAAEEAGSFGHSPFADLKIEVGQG
jgi:translation initiation factor IF-3